jgi:glyoxylase I family protein
MSLPVSNPPPFRLRGIEHVLLLVSGLEPAISFYERAVGATVESRLPGLAMAELRAGDSHIDLVDIGTPEGAWALPTVAGGRNLDHIGLRLEGDQTALRRHLADCGVEVIEERINGESPVTSLSLYVRDPSGNVVELMIAPVPESL